MHSDLLDDARARDLVDAFARVRLLVVGDVFLDEYLYGDALRVSPEAPVPIVRVDSELVVLGGAGNVARNVVALGAGCALCAVVGGDAQGERVRALLDEQGVDGPGVLRVEGRPTTHKTRVVARGQQVVRADRETDEPLPVDVVGRLLERIEAVLPAVGAVVVEDYGKGLLSEDLARPLMRAASVVDVPVYVDPKHTLAPFAGAVLVKPNLAEAERLSGQSAAADGSLEGVARELQKRVGGADLVITRGADGITIFEGAAPGVRVRTRVREVFDVQGAGDTIIATLTLARQAGASLFEASVLANAAASVVVGKTGTATVDREELLAALPGVRAAALAGQDAGEGT